MADAAPATDAVAMLELQVTIFPLVLPDHLIAFMWALIVVAAALSLALFGAALVILESVLETIKTKPGRSEAST